MKSELFDVEQVVDQVPPNGEYKGKWSGYVVEFSVNGGKWRAKTDSGIRGVADCSVKVDGWSVTVATKQGE
jgi:hypothetical protein